MEFSEQIKMIRRRSKLTQEELAKKLNVSRQAVSNWENNRNLPDLEMLIKISSVFEISLDQLILGDAKINKMTEKLIKDTDENRKAKFNMITTISGFFLMLMGFMCFVIKANSVEYVDRHGFLHESFYLIPVGYLFLLAGLIIIISGVIIHLKSKKDER